MAKVSVIMKMNPHLHELYSSFASNKVYER